VASLEEGQRDGAPDAAAGARHQNDFLAAHELARLQVAHAVPSRKPSLTLS
jgi:hypothetical protein